jgi:FkbM family methyltransferase
MTGNNLIFDLGFHNGDDTHYYLAKGFNVVAIEANPYLVAEGEKRFAPEIMDGRLNLINKAISSEKGKIEFYIHRANSDWSSCFEDIVKSDGSEPETVMVAAVSLHQLYKQFGVPYYAKVDLEGCDVYTARQVFEYKEKPDFISFETSKRDYAGIFSYLFVAGYQRFQLLNQLVNQQRIVESGSNTDAQTGYRFTKFSSGPFGKDLPADKWLSFDEVLSRYIKYKELKQLDNKELGLGWLDIHASYY